MKAGTKKKPPFYKVRAIKGQATTTLRAESLRGLVHDSIKDCGKRGASVADLEAAFDRPLRTTLHKLIEAGHIEAVYPK